MGTLRRGGSSPNICFKPPTMRLLLMICIRSSSFWGNPESILLALFSSSVGPSNYAGYLLERSSRRSRGTYLPSFLDMLISQPIHPAAPFPFHSGDDCSGKSDFQLPLC